MSDYQPKFTVSAESISLVSEISSLATMADLSGCGRDVRLRKKNRVLTIQSSLQIEANTLTVARVHTSFHRRQRQDRKVLADSHPKQAEPGFRMDPDRIGREGQSIILLQSH